MDRLRDIANSIRGTNNGATRRSFDIMFDKTEDFQRVWSSGAINAELIAKLYKSPGRRHQDLRLPAGKRDQDRYAEKSCVRKSRRHRCRRQAAACPLLDIEIP